MDKLTEILKQQTRTEHAFTEQQLGAKTIFSSAYTLAQYQQHLQHLLKVHVVANAIFLQRMHLIPQLNWLPTNRVADLEADIKAIDPNFLKNSVAQVKIHFFANLAQLIGLMYVIKGSELGGNIIATKIQEYIKLWQLPNAQFYRFTSPETLKNNWVQWCTSINNMSVTDEFITDAIEGAKQAFNLCVQPNQYVVLAN